jgi:regulator of cell morphogenesis and NO signaling
MLIQPETTLREIANAGDAARQLLDRAGLDFCCDGERSLRDACESAGVDEAALERALRALPPGKGRDWHHEGVSALLDHILGRCHPETRTRLANLQSVANGLMPRGPSANAFREAVDQFVTHATAQMNDEETRYFAHARALADARKGRGPFPATPLRTIHDHERELREGHARRHKNLRRVRALADAIQGQGAEDARRAIDAACGALEEQMHLENNELLPRARDLEPNGHVVP